MKKKEQDGNHSSSIVDCQRLFFSFVGCCDASTLYIGA